MPHLNIHVKPVKEPSEPRRSHKREWINTTMMGLRIEKSPHPHWELKEKASSIKDAEPFTDRLGPLKEGSISWMAAAVKPVPKAKPIEVPSE
jgi:hypothetical protein